MDSLFELWGKRNPYWEKKYEDSIIKRYTDYGVGAGRFGEDKGKIYGAGYEIFIIAFFIGLYSNKKKPLSKETDKKKTFGQPIMYWGNAEVRNMRTQYGDLMRYVFSALVAKTEIDVIGLDKGEIEAKDVVSQLMKTMEEYANYGFQYMSELLDEDQNCFFKEGAFLNMFLQFITSGMDTEDDLPESLD